MNKIELKNFVENNPNLVKLNATSHEGLYVLKYAKKVFYDNLWNRFLEECRGAVVDSDYNIVSLPFTKIYNYGIEDRAPKFDSDKIVRAYRKVNGFMAALTWHKGKMIISTTGSLDSVYVGYVRDCIEKCHHIIAMEDILESYENRTFLFECVHEKDPHIIPEQIGLHFLGYREKDWNSKVSGFENWNPKIIEWMQSIGVMIPETFECTVGELQKLSKEVRHEGFVAYTRSNESFKIKSPYYLFSKFLARTKNPKKLMDKGIKKELDEEYYGLVDKIQEYPGIFLALNEQERLNYIRDYFYEVKS